MAIQLYLHSLASDPQIQGPDHAMMVAQQHIQEADLAKKGPKAQGPQAQVGPAAQQGAPPVQPIADMGPASTAPKLAAISSFSYEKFSSAQLPFAEESGRELARAWFRGRG